MRVRFVDGPLEGREEEVADVGEGLPVYWPQPPSDVDEEPETPGMDDVVEYLYVGNGEATYVGGQLEET